MKNLINDFVLETTRELERIGKSQLTLTNQISSQDSYQDLFRSLHNIKGTCGFLGFHRLELLTHSTEDLLEGIKKKKVSNEREAVSHLGEALNQLKLLVDHIGISNQEPEGSDKTLIQTLKKISQENILVDQRNALNIPTDIPSETNAQPKVDTESEKNTASPGIDENLWDFIPRLVQNTAYTLGREVHLEVNEQFYSDNRPIQNRFKTSLTHMIRNAISHGIEPPSDREAIGKRPYGTLSIKTLEDRGYFILVVQDDGRGINLQFLKEKIIEGRYISKDILETLTDQEIYQYIFTPGLSTATEKSTIYGRGIGMDVVMNTVEKSGGTIEIHSEQNKGTTFTIKVPLPKLARG